MKKIKLIIEGDDNDAGFWEWDAKRSQKRERENQAAVEGIMRRTIRVNKPAVIHAVKQWANERVEAEGLPPNRDFACRSEDDCLKIRKLPLKAKTADLCPGESFATLEGVAKLSDNKVLLLAAKCLRWIETYNLKPNDWLFARIYSVYEDITQTKEDKPSQTWPRPEKTTLYIDVDRQLVRVCGPNCDKKLTYGEVGLLDQRGHGGTRQNKSAKLLYCLAGVDRCGGILPISSEVNAMDISKLRAVLRGAFGWPSLCLQKEGNGWQPAFKVVADNVGGEDALDKTYAERDEDGDDY